MNTKTRPIYICCLQKTHFRPQDTYRLKVRGWKIYSMQMGSKRKATSNIQGKNHMINSRSFSKRKWQDIFKVLKEKKENLLPRLLYMAKISFKIDGEIKCFTDKQKLRQFSTNQPALQEIIKELT